MEISSSQTGMAWKLPTFKNQTNMRIGLHRPTSWEWTYNQYKTLKIWSIHTFKMKMNIPTHKKKWKMRENLALHHHKMKLK
eukprot:9924355-Ditylum_brightwellii.AAC.1